MSRKPWIREIPEHARPIEKKTWRKGEPLEKQKEVLESLRELVRRRKAWLEYLDGEYQEYQNPYCAWDAFLLADRWGLPLSPAIREYFLTCGKTVMKTSRTKDIPFALGFGGRRGKGSLLRQYTGQRTLEYGALQKQWYINTARFRDTKKGSEADQAAEQAAKDANLRFGTRLDTAQIIKHKIFRKR
jgi:hypothetical protein